MSPIPAIYGSNVVGLSWFSALRACAASNSDMLFPLTWYQFDNHVTALVSDTASIVLLITNVEVRTAARLDRVDHGLPAVAGGRL